MFIYACECIGLRNIVIMMYMYLAMLYPINDLNMNLNLNLKILFRLCHIRIILDMCGQKYCNM